MRCSPLDGRQKWSHLPELGDHEKRETRATISRPLAATQATITGGDVREGDLRSQPPSIEGEVSFEQEQDEMLNAVADWWRWTLPVHKSSGK